MKLEARGLKSLSPFGVKDVYLEVLLSSLTNLILQMITLKKFIELKAMRNLKS